MKSIYICAKAGAGKTSCAEYLRKKGYIVANFSYPVYNIGYDYFNMSRSVKDRKLLQFIGTDAGRYYDKDIWVERFVFDVMVVERTRNLLNMPKAAFVNADTRFINEHNTLKKAGWLGIYLDASDEIRIQRLKSRDNIAQIETLNHISETALDEFKHELTWIDANGPLQEMFENLNTAINQPFVIKQSNDDFNYQNAFKNNP